MDRNSWNIFVDLSNPICIINVIARVELNFLIIKIPFHKYPDWDLNPEPSDSCATEDRVYIVKVHNSPPPRLAVKPTNEIARSSHVAIPDCDFQETFCQFAMRNFIRKLLKKENIMKSYRNVTLGIIESSYACNQPT